MCLHLTWCLPVPNDDVINRLFVESSALEQVVAICPGMASEWAGFVSSQASEGILSKRHVRCVADQVVGSLVAKAPDSGPEGLGSMPVPPNTLRVYTEYVLVKSVGPKVLWAESSRVQGTGENVPPIQFHA
ncbi:uncharacterized protein TNCV_913631 [Trichonephila clavipes]|nr:uncharacterized protein TNCV_913631 [Trichonephila clavipes]